MQEYDVIIVGAGISGLLCAAMLAKHTPFSILILESKSATANWSIEQSIRQVSAITLATQCHFAALQCWQSIQQLRASCFEKIAVWLQDDKTKLIFDASDIAQPYLGHIVENHLMQWCLQEKIKNLSQIVFMPQTTLLDLKHTTNGIALHTADQIFHTPLLIGADGVQSWVREHAQITVQTHAYQACAITATVKTALPHARIARQIFTADGPLAFLPLNDLHHCSIVWSLPETQADGCMQLKDAAFNEQLTATFETTLGAVEVMAERVCVPLIKQQATHYIAPHVALIGDAVHRLHPLAGQGLNIGIADAVSLVQVITAAYQQNRPLGEITTLRRYERWRKSENTLLLQGIDWIRTLFSQEKPTLKRMNIMGFKTLQWLPMMKNMFTRVGSGLPLF